jgi:hypothetical protein
MARAKSLIHIIAVAAFGAVYVAMEPSIVRPNSNSTLKSALEAAEFLNLPPPSLHHIVVVVTGADDG